MTPATIETTEMFPAAWTSSWAVAIGLTVSLLAVGLVSLLRRRPRLTEASFLAWFVIILVVPALGALLWFTVGMPDRGGRHS
jgi:hypothetical protein